MTHYDAAIVGSGFAGSILARVLRRQGRRVLLVEKRRHPRFALGESTTPLANFSLERLAERYGLEDLRQLSTWGRWQADLAHLRRGLKRGFTFYSHQRDEPFHNSARNEARLLVAASPSDAIADTHWLRADVDHHLVERAVAEGVDYLDETALDGVEIGSRIRLSGARHGRRVRFTVRDVVDGSGDSGWLARSGAVRIRPAEGPLPIESGLLFSHFERPASFVDVARRGGAVLEAGPYPDEKAAVHHLLDGLGWMYVLPFDHGPVSAGIVVRTGAGVPSADEMRRDPDAIWWKLLARYPSLAAQFEASRPVYPLRYIERIQHRFDRAAGPRWFLLPHTFAFYEPLFSTGMAWSLLAVERLASLFEGRHGDAAAYERQLATEADRIGLLARLAYGAFDDFDLFAALSHLYFVTVSYKELAQRLRPEDGRQTPIAWQGLLGVGDPFFDTLFDEAAERLTGLCPTPSFSDWLRRRLAPRNVAGLADPDRRNLYPVDLDVLLDRHALLGLTRAEVLAALPRLRGDAVPSSAVS